MATSPVGNVNDIVAGGNTTGRSINNKLGKDEFLKILITQLANQDPSHPLEDKEFIAQMAQFTSVEQLTNMATELKALRQSMGFSPAFIGKEISWTVEDSSGHKTVKHGVVDGLTYKDGNQFATVNEEEVALDQVVKVTNPV